MSTFWFVADIIFRLFILFLVGVVFWFMYKLFTKVDKYRKLTNEVYEDLCVGRNREAMSKLSKNRRDVDVVDNVFNLIEEKKE